MVSEKSSTITTIVVIGGGVAGAEGKVICCIEKVH